MKNFICVIAIVISSLSLFAQEPSSIRPVHTFSIVARDSVTGDLGVAVQSHWFSVGSLVTWAEAGVGAVATQSFVDPSYGKLGLDLMRSGKSAQQSLDALLASDPGRDVRQVAFVDVKGNVAAHTGAKCIESAGHIVGKQYSVQANLMLNDKIWPAMSKAFESAKGDLADRMLAALDAAQAAGGDIRGKQSAAILIVKAQSTGRQWADKVIDLRVEDHPAPLQELRRLVSVHRAYDHMNNGDLAVEHNDIDGALREYGTAETMFPDNLEMKFWHAVALVNAGKVDASLPIFKEIFAKDSNWLTLIPRLPKSGTLTANDATIRKILSANPKNNVKELPMNKRVTGIGGIFFKCDDPKAQKLWYQKHLGIPPVVDETGGMFVWREKDQPDQVGQTVWSPFKKETDYFAPSTKPFMFNYRVENLVELLAQLKKEGVQIVGKMEEYDFGKFGWIMDPEGNKIELWEPVDKKLSK